MNGKWKVYLREFNSPPHIYKSPYQRPIDRVNFYSTDDPKELYDNTVNIINRVFGSVKGKLSINDYSFRKFSILCRWAWDHTLPATEIGSIYQNEKSFGIFVEKDHLSDDDNALVTHDVVAKIQSLTIFASPQTIPGYLSLILPDDKEMVTHFHDARNGVLNMENLMASGICENKEFRFFGYFEDDVFHIVDYVIDNFSAEKYPNLNREI